MKVRRHGNREIFVLVCPKCAAELEYTKKDIKGGDGSLVDPGWNYNDYCDTPQIKVYDDPMVNYIINTYNDEYVEVGYIYKRDGYIVCPECGRPVTLMIIQLSDSK